MLFLFTTNLPLDISEQYETRCLWEVSVLSAWVMLPFNVLGRLCGFCMLLILIFSFWLFVSEITPRGELPLAAWMAHRMTSDRRSEEW